jgi:hypothetical protein
MNFLFQIDSKLAAPVISKLIFFHQNPYEMFLKYLNLISSSTSRDNCLTLLQFLFKCIPLLSNQVNEIRIQIANSIISTFFSDDEILSYSFLVLSLIDQNFIFSETMNQFIPHIVGSYSLKSICFCFIEKLKKNRKSSQLNY